MLYIVGILGNHICKWGIRLGQGRCLVALKMLPQFFSDCSLSSMTVCVRWCKKIHQSIPRYYCLCRSISIYIVTFCERICQKLWQSLSQRHQFLRCYWRLLLGPVWKIVIVSHRSVLIGNYVVNHMKYCLFFSRCSIIWLAMMCSIILQSIHVCEIGL